MSGNNKQVYIYRAVLDPVKYPPNSGDPINSKLETPSETANKPLLRSLEEALNSSIFNLDFFEKKIVSETIITNATDPGNIADGALKFLAFSVFSDSCTKIME